MRGRHFIFGAAIVFITIGCAHLNGTVYRDTNDNGKFDAGIDMPLSGAAVYLSNGKDAPRSTVSDLKGNYVFSNIKGGKYSLL